ncbi:endonuclease/exonuclease/phosphatase family protein [Actinophytocola sp.]|uniref:endonuclease/exonuclease/phosphatase family protein n=1 Tax=Actinophytocola sp. TaxID=1872138 RepID=UPI002ED53F1C
MNRVIMLLMALGLLVIPSTVACAGTTSTGATSTGPTSTGPTSAATTITVLQLNICHGGMAGCYRGDAVMGKADEVIRSSKPQVLSVNEACEGDVERLRPAMGPARALFVAARNLDGTPTMCTGTDQQYGNIIMVTDGFAGTTEETGTYDAQNRSLNGHLELRSWACLTAAELSACTTHLSSDSAPIALAQCQDLMSRASAYPGPAIVLGDFNLKDQGSPGMRDCDPAGFSRRGDGSVQHLYASNDLSFAQTTSIDMTGTTDHPGLLASLTSTPR